MFVKIVPHMKYVCVEINKIREMQSIFMCIARFVIAHRRLSILVSPSVSEKLLQLKSELYLISRDPFCSDDSTKSQGDIQGE